MPRWLRAKGAWRMFAIWSLNIICISLVAIKKYQRNLYGLEDGKGVDLNATNEGFTTLDFHCQEISVRLLDNGIPLLSCSAECIYAVILHNFGQNILQQVGKSCDIHVLKNFILNKNCECLVLKT